MRIAAFRGREATFPWRMPLSLVSGSGGSGGLTPLGTWLTGPRASRPASPLAVVDRTGFEQAVLRHDRASLVLFGAAWRRPSIDAAAQLWHGAERYGILPLFVDVERSPELARRYRVTAIPSLLLFRGGQEAQRRLGELSADGLEDWLAASLA